MFLRFLLYHILYFRSRAFPYILCFFAFSLFCTKRMAEIVHFSQSVSHLNFLSDRNLFAVRDILYHKKEILSRQNPADFQKNRKIGKKHKMGEQTTRQTQDVVVEMKQERMMDKEERINKLQKDIEPMKPIYSFYFFILYFRPDQMLSSRYRIRDFVSRLRCTAP